MNELNQIILQKNKKFNLIYCAYNYIFLKVNYKYELIKNIENPDQPNPDQPNPDQPLIPKLAIIGFKKIKYQYDFSRNQLNIDN